MAVGTFQKHALAVEVKPVAVAHLERAEAETLRNLMDDHAVLFEANLNLIQIGRFRRPEFRELNLRSEIISCQIHFDYFGMKGLANFFPIKRLDLRLDCIGIRWAIQKYIGKETPISACVNRNPLDELRRHRLQPHGPEDAAIHPVIASALGTVDGVIGGVFGDGHF